MRITYDRFPVLRWLKKPASCNIAAPPTCPKMSYFFEHIVKDPALWMKIYAHRVDFCSRPFTSALIRSTTAFERVVNEPGFRFDPDCGVFLSQQFGAILYECDGDFLDILQLSGHVVLAASRLNLQTRELVHLEEPGLRKLLSESYQTGGQTIDDTTVGMFLHTVVMTYMLMLRYAKVETLQVYPRQHVVDDSTTDTPEKRNGRPATEPAFQNLTDIRINYRTSRWFTAICCDHDFAVRGHFRLQPKKDQNGKWTKELIYINPFVKHGYHRSAQIEQTTAAAVQ